MKGAVWLTAGLATILSILSACSHSPKQPSETEDPSSPASSTGSSSSGSSGGRYAGKDKDWGPDNEMDMSNVPDAVPRYELRTIAGNKNPYTVLGKTYHLMKDERAYKERGKASWYGYKFNGERTSNGELYDMFNMTGAHKTLPIPSYVRVTNIANQKSVVVRINDRGPFHGNRIIDLSYAAAQRLGITRAGTGDVEVEIVVPEGDPRPPLRGKKGSIAKQTARGEDIVSQKEAGITSAMSSQLPAGTFLQIAAFGAEKSARQFVDDVSARLGYPVIISEAQTPQHLYRVRVGPFKDAQAVQAARDELLKINISQSHVVYE
jgi:rare lipoprotein A